MPEDSLAPFLTTLALAAFFTALLTHVWWVAVAAAAATLVALVVQNVRRELQRKRACRVLNLPPFWSPRPAWNQIAAWHHHYEDPRRRSSHLNTS